MNQGLYVVALTLAVIVLAAPPAIFFGYNGLRAYRSLRDWIRWLRAERRAKRYLATR